jgi:nitroimidazol reductase NimA-like FMN-containing flavoprotein (pyridoxamine 5'-phosphate oxidase superfamily)
MKIDERQAMVADFFKKEKYVVVASTWNGSPQAATVAFTERSNHELIFATSNCSRKYRNLKADPKIAVVVGWDEAVTVQGQGSAFELAGQEQVEAEEAHLKKHPTSARYSTLVSQRFFQVKFSWIRYTDISQEPEFSFEINF